VNEELLTILIFSAVGYLTDEGMLLVCILAKLVKTKTESLAIQYSTTDKIVSDITGMFTSENCPAMNGKPKVFIMLDGDTGHDDLRTERV